MVTRENKLKLGSQKDTIEYESLVLRFYPLEPQNSNEHKRMPELDSHLILFQRDGLIQNL